MSKPLYTIPSWDEITEVVRNVPDYMYPNVTAYALVGEGVLSDEICDAILDLMSDLEPYKFEHCDAVTKETIRPLHHYFEPVLEFTLQANRSCWRFDVDEDSATGFLQSYVTGDAYQMHQDTVLGQTRKLTSIVMLTDSAKYTGGELRVVPYPMARVIPPTRGTIVTFPSWLFHEVFPVKSGHRQTLNLGMWGPHWR